MSPTEGGCKSHSWGDGMVTRDADTGHDELIFACGRCGVKRITSYDGSNGTFSTRLVGGKRA